MLNFRWVNFVSWESQQTLGEVDRFTNFRGPHPRQKGKLPGSTFASTGESTFSHSLCTCFLSGYVRLPQSCITTENRPGPKRTWIIFQRLIFRGDPLVSGSVVAPPCPSHTAKRPPFPGFQSGQHMYLCLAYATTQSLIAKISFVGTQATRKWEVGGWQVLVGGKYLQD